MPAVTSVKADVLCKKYHFNLVNSFYIARQLRISETMRITQNRIFEIFIKGFILFKKVFGSYLNNFP